jgi:hypothetical protein
MGEEASLFLAIQKEDKRVQMFSKINPRKREENV